jgi:flagellar hook-associated protein 2
MSMAASAVGNEIKLFHNSFGAAASFAVSFVAGGSDGTAQLGIGAASYTGTDVIGTIGGHAATGTGQQLVGATGTPVDGLSLSYRDAILGNVGTVTLTQGVGAMIDRLVKSWTEASGGTIASKETGLGATIESQQKRLDALNTRLALRRQNLLKQFLAMDTAVARFKSQASAFASVLPKKE